MTKKILNEDEIKRLQRLGEKIQISLSPLADPNGFGIPSRSNRFALIDSMKEYLEIHNYELKLKDQA